MCVCMCVCVCVCAYVCVCVCVCVCRSDDSSSLVISSLASDQLPDELQRTSNALRRSVYTQWVCHLLLGVCVHCRGTDHTVMMLSA